jgi:YegS/Rv2252/BmrU family lipid kinase
MHNDWEMTHIKLRCECNYRRRFQTVVRFLANMASDEYATRPAPLDFKPDSSSKTKKGAHKPQYAPVFTQKSKKGKATKRVHMLVNPYSGKRKGRATGELAKSMFEAQGVEVSIHFSAYSGHLIKIASEIKAKASDVFVVVGGDGSLSEVVTGRMQAASEKSELFGLVPAGTGNSVAHDLAIGTTEEAVNHILKGRNQAFDLAKVEMGNGLPGAVDGTTTRYSHNLVTWGLGVDSTIKAEKMRWMGPIRYDVGIVMAIMANNRRQATLTVDGVEMKSDFTLFLIQNSQTGGSMLPLAPGASLDDGIMDIGILKKMTRREVFKAFSMLKAEGRHVFHPQVDYHRFTTLSIETPEPTAINIDGENIGSTPLSMKVMPGAIRVCVPHSE